MKININQYVTVRLTNEGALHLLSLPPEPKCHDVTITMNDDEAKTTDLRCQLWEFMQLLGPVVSKNGPPMFESIIQIEPLPVPVLTPEELAKQREEESFTQRMRQAWDDTTSSMVNSRDREV